MIRRPVAAILVVLGVALLAVQAAGLMRPADFRDRFDERVLSYDAALAELDAAFAEAGPGRAFLERAVAIYDAATVYRWPEHMARVPATDNWILWSAAWADPALKRAGLTDLDGLFAVYESIDYERALARGFGICSQLALGLIDLLDRRYGMTAHLVELDGHVVAEAELPGGERYLIDPTAGVLLPFGLDAAPAALDEIRAVYQAAGQVGLSTTYDAAGNVRLAEPGTRPFRPRLYWIERGSDVAKWALPAAMIAAGTMLWPRRRRG